MSGNNSGGKSSLGEGPARRRTTGAMPAKRRPVTPESEVEAVDEAEVLAEVDEGLLEDPTFDGVEGEGDGEGDEGEYDEYEYDTDPDEEDEVEAPAPTRRSARAARAAAAAAESADSAADGEAGSQAKPRRKGLFDRSNTVLDNTEQMVGYALGAATAIIAAVGYLPLGIADDGQDNLPLAALGVVLGVLLVVAARSRRRMPTAIVALLANFASGVDSTPPFRWSSFLSFACVIYGGFVLLRTSNERARLAGEERRRKMEESRANGGTARGGRPSSSGGRKGAGSTAVRGPAPNKRYTPPKAKPKPRTLPPPPPAVKASRWGRKAMPPGDSDDGG